MANYNYKVIFEPYTERHYIKKFKKEYRQQWDVTENAIISVCERIDNVLSYSRADLIASKKGFKLVKLDFAVPGTRMSPKASGNRCILLVNEAMHEVKVLLVYSKDEISEPNETVKWKEIIKREYAEVGKLFEL